MADTAQILFLLVGRGGSKGLPGKNLREIAGLSLIGYKAATRYGARDFASIIRVSATNYEVVVEHNYAADAQLLLATR